MTDAQNSNLKSQIPLAGQLDVIKGMWAELLLLFERSAEEDPLTEQTGGLDKVIDPLMRNMDGEMGALRTAVERARTAGVLGAALEAELAEFEDQLRAGLQIMSERITERSAELAAQRGQLKERLMGLKLKRQGTQGYRGYNTGRKLLDSSI